MKLPIKRPTSFTLIELLIVIFIIVILAVLVLQTSGIHSKRPAPSRAHSEISALSTALESYHADFGYYPSSSNFPNTGLGTNSLYGALAPSTGKIYFEFDKGMTNAQGIVDPFGQPYQYRFPGAPEKSGSNFFDLWSYGGARSSKQIDKTNNHIFWIVNW